ncbi:GNAT family N-acetyltransferase [Haladaptatus sp. DYF46]|uniref:GNAT family N-acetyltransferase n=1 Tax=Haladaptatus sp. DYF46 TaxID=2886041 RepID=UPI001E44D851|nr:GNAT family N-acetyltransferase [Haladaptatus sp. DYF46]
MPDEHERLTVRRYRDRDKNAVWRVHDRSLRDSAMCYSPEYNRYLRHIPTAFLEGDGEFLVATMSTTGDDRTAGTDDPDSNARTNGIVGIGGFQPLERSKPVNSDIRRALDADVMTAHVRSVAVLPDAQSSGVGTVLTTELERRAATRDFSQAVLSTPVELTGAHGFYESRGYEVLPMAAEDGDADSDHYWYRKSLV